jgi:hypothetical protein
MLTTAGCTFSTALTTAVRREAEMGSALAGPFKRAIARLKRSVFRISLPGSFRA